MTPDKKLWQHYQTVLLPTLLLFMAGTLSGLAWPMSSFFWGCWFFVALGLLFILLRYTRSKTIFLLITCFIGYSLGGVYGSLVSLEPPESDITHLASRPATEITGQAVERGNAPGQWVMHVTTCDDIPVTGKILLKLPPAMNSQEQPFQIGDTLQVSGRLTVPGEAQFPGQFDYKAYLQTQKITALLYANRFTVEKPSQRLSPWLSLLRLTDTVRLKINDHFKRNLPSPEAEIIASIVLGEHAVGLDYRVKQHFRQAGLIHLLAASGLNVGLIGAFFLLLGRWCRMPLRMSLTIAMLGVGFYCLLTGLPPSVQRAGTMLELALFLKWLNRAFTPLMLLSISGVLLTLFNPLITVTLGFQLSFLSTYGLLAMLPPLQGWLGFYVTPFVAGIVLVPLVAQLWVTPILLYHFHQVQLLSLPANIVALPWVAVLTYVGFVSGGLSLLLPELTGSVLSACGFCVSILKHIANFFGTQTYSIWHVASPPLPTIILMMGMLFGTTYLLRTPKSFSPRLLISLGCLLCLMVLIPPALAKWIQSDRLCVTWLPSPAGQGLQIIEAGSGPVVIHAPKIPFWTGKDIEAYLRKRGITQIQMLVLSNVRTHYDTAGLEMLLESFPVEYLVIPPGIAENQRNHILDLAEQWHIPVIQVQGTYRIQSPHFSIMLYSVAKEAMVTRIHWKNQCMGSYFGKGHFAQSMLKTVVEDCAIVFDTQQKQLHLLKPVESQPNPVDIPGFHRVILASGSIHIETLPSEK